MKRPLKIVLPILILVFAVLGALRLVRARPMLEREDMPVSVPMTQVLKVEQQPIRLNVQTQGTVLPRTEAVLAAEVHGRVINTASDLDVGHFVERGAPLIFLDDRDFRLELRQAQSRMTQARLELARQEAEARLAVREWQTLGEGVADPLVLRTPQVAQAKAELEAAAAEIAKIELSLERTKIRAPFRGRIREKLVDVGQYLSPGQAVAKMHAIDFAEVRLPLSDRDLRFLDVPLGFHDANSSEPGPVVELSASFSGQLQVWLGRIVRSEAEVDSRSRMVHLVARIDDPYGLQNGQTVLPVGLFVEANIAGRRLESAVLLPRSAVTDGHVWLLRDDKTLTRRSVDLLRITGEIAVISNGLENGEQVCVSPPSTAIEGMQVRRAPDDAVDVGPLPSTITRLAVDVPHRDVPLRDVPHRDVAHRNAEKTTTEVASDQLSTKSSLTHLTEISTERTENGVTIEIHADRDLHYTTLRLDAPARFAVDLPRCSPGDQPRLLNLDQAPVERIRIGQFRGGSEPVTRIVFDLRRSVEPTLERGETWLRISFPEAQP